jgi:hypothetical protein
MGAVYLKKLQDLRRKNNRLISQRITIRSAADVYRGSSNTVPLTRAASLGESLLAF